MRDTSTSVESVPQIVEDIYRLVEKLEALFPGRRFTPDGHLVGSIGEVVASHRYGLELLPASAERHDAKTKSGVMVQIKATQASMVGIRAEPEHLIVLYIGKDGHASEIYNGPGSDAWCAAGKMQKNGQRPISVSKLKKLMNEIGNGSRIREAV